MNSLSREELEKNRIEKEKLCKEAEELSRSTNWRETAERLKAIQKEWKAVGHVPSEFVQDLNERLRKACDTFFDNRSENFRLLELERIDNLYRKIELCEKAEALKNHHDLQFAIESVKELFQEWKSIGPVPREKSDDVWERFRAAQDVLFEKRRLKFQELDKQRRENLEIKVKYCEEAELLSESDDFSNTTQAIIDLQERWKAGGPVPQEESENIWERFRAACDNFFQRKNEHFSKLDEERLENLIKRKTLCSKAEELKDSVNWHETTELMKELQAEWKSAYPVPRDEGEELWESFRAACDHFFERKREHYEEKQKEWQKNQAVWRMNMGKAIQRKEEEIERIIAASAFEQNHIEEWKQRLENLPADLKSIDMKMEIESKIEKAKEELERKNKLILKFQSDIEEIKQKLLSSK